MSMNKLKLGIIGKGFVGSAVSNGFDRNVEQFVVDPLLEDNTIDDLVKYVHSFLYVFLHLGMIHMMMLTPVLLETYLLN